MEASFRNAGDQSREVTNGTAVQQFRYSTSFESTFRRSSSSGARVSASASPPLYRKETPRSAQSSPRGSLYGSLAHSGPRSVHSMSPPLVAPRPQLRVLVDAVEESERRVLPPREVTDETIDDAYVSFILYCNPNVPASVDTGELRKCFRNPPRSDGKNFSIYTLWELVRKLDRKELKTWIQLAIELGVEPPSLEKKQSTQKVQQYAVRLKVGMRTILPSKFGETDDRQRWMRAMHVDAFFEYLLGHPHVYYAQIPSRDSPPSEMRDGVLLEDDLALRALVPEWRPKRGRKRAEDRQAEEERRKRPHLDTSAAVWDSGSLAAHATNFPQSAIPFSPFPDDTDATDPWAAAASSFGASAPRDDVLGDQDFRWLRDHSPGYPRSAVTPRTYTAAEAAAETQPRSAITPVSGEKLRNRRRHGPAVSSAWTNTNASITGKLRGRPPSKGSVPGSGFSFFPVKPVQRPSSTDNSRNRSSPLLRVDKSPSTVQTTTVQGTDQSTANARPGKLHLQVPQNPGRPVRLATPQTTASPARDEARMSNETVPSERRESFAASNTPSQDLGDVASMSPFFTERSPTGTSENLSTERIIHALAGEIMHAKLVGRSHPIEAPEARNLARAAVRKLRAKYAGVPLPMLMFFCAMFFGIGQKIGIDNTAPSSLTVSVTNSTTETGYLAGSFVSSPIYSIQTNVRVSSDISLNGTLTDISLQSDSNDNHDTRQNSKPLDLELEHDLVDPYGPDEEGTWRQRYLRLRQYMQRKEAALREYKKNIIQSVMADI